MNEYSLTGFVTLYLGPLGANGSNTAVQYSASVVPSSGSLRQYGMSSILTGSVETPGTRQCQPGSCQVTRRHAHTLALGSRGSWLGG